MVVAVVVFLWGARRPQRMASPAALSTPGRGARRLGGCWLLLPRRRHSASWSRPATASSGSAASLGGAMKGRPRSLCYHGPHLGRHGGGALVPARGRDTSAPTLARRPH